MEKKQLLSLLEKQMVPYRVGDKWGFSDLWGEVIVQPKYMDVVGYEFDIRDGEYFHSYALVTLFDDTMTMIDETGREVVPGMPYFGYTISVERALMMKYQNEEGKFGALMHEEVIIPFEYDSFKTSLFSDNIVVSQGEQYGVIDQNNKILIPLEYDEVELDIHGEDKLLEEYHCKKDGVEEVIQILRTEPKEVQDELWDEAIDGLMSGKFHPVKDVYEVVEVNGKRTYRLVKTGKTMTTQYDEIQPLSESVVSSNNTETKVFYVMLNGQDKVYFQVKQEGKYGVIDENEKIILPVEYDKIDHSHGIEFFKNGFAGLIDFTNGVRFEPEKYESIQPAYFSPYRLNESETFALYEIELNGNTAYIGENGVEYFDNI